MVTENFHDLAKEMDIHMQEVQSPKRNELKEAHTKTVLIKVPKVT